MEIINNKFIYFYLDTIGLDLESPYTYVTYTGTTNAIGRRLRIIYTTSLANLSFDLLDEGYRIYLVRNGDTLELKPGMKESDMEIKRGHNILKIVLSGYFDNLFPNQIY